MRDAIGGIIVLQNLALSLLNFSDFRVMPQTLVKMTCPGFSLKRARAKFINGISPACQVRVLVT